MDEKRFDLLVRARAEGASRRSVLKGLFGGIVGGAAVAAGAGRAFAQDGTETSDETTTPAPTLETTAAPEVATTPAPDTATTAAPAEEVQEAETCSTEWCGDKCCWEGEYCCDGHCIDEGTCCNNWQCQEYYSTSCAICYYGLCIENACAEKGLYCCEYDVVQGEENHVPVCSECCEDYDCGDNCLYCSEYGTCEKRCDKDEFCCDYGTYATCNHECCESDDCKGGCEDCINGYCRSYCDEYETCCHGEFCHESRHGCCGIAGDWCDETSASGEKLDGSCCDGLYCCYDDKKKGNTCAECCDDHDCPEYWVCCDGYCAECCKDKDCEGYEVCVEGACVQCSSDKECDKDEICCGGWCEHAECCVHGEIDRCDHCEICWNGWCEQAGYGFGESCGHVQATAEGSLQLDCCDGLFCCGVEDHYDDIELVCLGCCHDGDCAKGCSCEKGSCSCGCDSDKDCEKGTCCCKNGSCSYDCCGKHEYPDKPYKPGKPGYGDSGDPYIDTLPSTGSGDSQTSAGWIGAAALGAAAAYVAAKVISSDSSEEDGQTAEG